MKSKTKILLGSTLTIAMCASLIAGSTLALFTSESKTNIAITSGKVDVKASITALSTYSNATEDIPAESIEEWTEADPTEGGGFTGTFENEGTVTYAVEDGAGTLSLTNITPGDAAKFTFSVVNESTIAIKYQVSIVVGEEKSTDDGDEHPDSKLSSVLELTFGGKTLKGFQQAATAWSDAIMPSSATSPVTQDVILRLPKDVGDEYQTKSSAITLSVFAVQGNAANSAYCDSHGHYYDKESNTCVYCGAKNPITGHLDPSGNFVIDSLSDPDATELEIPGTVGGAPVSIPKDLFQGNEKLESVTLGEGITEIGDEIFKQCHNLTQVTLPESLTSIGNNAFEECIELQSIDIPDSVESIGTYAFQNCYVLESVTLGANVTEIGEGTFYNCNLLTIITFEGEVTAIGTYAFSGCNKLATIDLPDSLTTIGDSAFYGCNILTTLALPEESLTTIEDSAFRRSGLTTITIPDCVTSLGKSVFSQCESLETVTLGTGIVSLENSLFTGCTSLTTLTIKGNLSSIGGNVFNKCTSLTAVTFAGTSEEWKAMANKPYYDAALSGCPEDCHVTCQGDSKVLDRDGNEVS